MNWIELDWIGSNWIELKWTRLNWIELDCIQGCMSQAVGSSWIVLVVMLFLDLGFNLTAEAALQPKKVQNTVFCWTVCASSADHRKSDARADGRLFFQNSSAVLTRVIAELMTEREREGFCFACGKNATSGICYQTTSETQKKLEEQNIKSGNSTMHPPCAITVHTNKVVGLPNQYLTQIRVQL